MLIVVISDGRHEPILNKKFFLYNTPFHAIYYNQPYKCMQKHSEEIFSQFVFNHSHKIKWFLSVLVLQQNNISPIFRQENILFA